MPGGMPPPLPNIDARPLNAHEIVNDRIGNRSIAVTW
jgi:hypothetical protein